MTQPFENKMYFALSLDPIHVGTGGYRLGRVDLSIIREPGTNLPKLPGTSLCGVARAYTAMHPEVNKYPSCAGKGGETGDRHCGTPEPACPVCIPFGFSKAGNSFQGLAQFSDVRILFFPVYSLLGPVWVTTGELLKDIGVSEDLPVSEGKFLPLKIKAGGAEYPSEVTNKNRVNFGWLMLEAEKKEGEEVTPPNEFPAVELKTILMRLVAVPLDLFSNIVNSNLEVRTSVSIDPDTGAAEEHALFTYEAIPRATVMWFSVVYNDPKNYRVEDRQIKRDGALADIEWVKGNVEKGLDYLQYMGIGGMGTRGMGRLKVLNLKGARK